MKISVPTVEQVADYGSEEPWAARIAIGIPELAQSILLNPGEYDKFMKDFGPLYKELNYAFIALLEIRKKPLRYKLEKEYSNLYDHLWTAYKDRCETLMRTIGYDVGFLFQKQATFEKESVKYIKTHGLRDELRLSMKRDRKSWQNALKDFRNDYRQHQKISAEIERVWFTRQCAEVTFTNVWQAIEDLLVTALENLLSKDSKSTRIVEIPEARRDPGLPKRFRLDLTPEAYASLRRAQAKDS